MSEPLKMSHGRTLLLASPPLWTANVATSSYTAAGVDVRYRGRPEAMGGMFGRVFQVGEISAMEYHYGAGGNPADWQGVTTADVITLVGSQRYTVIVYCVTGAPLGNAPACRITATMSAFSFTAQDVFSFFVGSDGAADWSLCSLSFVAPGSGTATIAVEFKRGSTAATDFLMDHFVFG